MNSSNRPTSQASAGSAETSYDVRIWKIRSYAGRRGNTYSVRWSVAGEEHHKTYKKRALADARRAELLTTSQQGIAFDIATGLPVTELRQQSDTSWYEHARDYVDTKWDDAAAKSRESIADALATVTSALLSTERGKPDPKTLRAAMYQWAFNMHRRRAAPPPEHLEKATQWVQTHTLPVSALADPEVLERALSAVSRKQDGSPAAGNTYGRKRSVLHNVLEHAVNKGYLSINPLTAPTTPVNRKTPKSRTSSEAVNPRVVVNPQQAEALLEAVRQQQRMGPHLVAFFGCLYYAGMRPAEAADLRSEALDLPEEGWGSLHLSHSAPSAGAAWTGDKRREHRGLKHRAADDVRPVPCPPQLTQLLHSHLAIFGNAADGRLFRGERGGQLSDSVYERVWARARKAALIRAEVASPLARRPYDLRHAALSTWLNAGVPATQVAEWAGNSVHVLLRVYAKCIAGQDQAARRRIEDMLSQ